MVLKAYITKLPGEGSNEFEVRIPYFEGNTNREVLYSALLCNQPGEYDGYEVGDCVFVTFEDIRLDVPIILGKLFVEKEAVKSSHVVSTLSVTDKIDLPATTTIGGYSTIDIFKNYQKSSSTSDMIANLDFEIVGEFEPDLNYDIVDEWPYSTEQEKYCKVAYQIYDVSYEEWVSK